MSLHPIMAAALAPFAPKNSSVHDEAKAIKADLAYNRMKDTGELHAREAHRALVDQIKHQEQS